jgi:hypothetical protein
MGDHQLENRKRIVTIGSENRGPTSVRSSIDARRISVELIQHSKSQEEERCGLLDTKLKGGAMWATI